MPDPPARPGGWRAWRNRLAASRGFQSWASRMPVLRGRARREGAALFDLVAGFAQSQVLRALVELEILHTLREGPQDAADLAPQVGLTEDRTRLLLDAGTALGLLERTRGGYLATARGAALLGVPGLEAMILHHEVLYRDLADPVALLRGTAETELAAFWPYVFGAGAAEDPGQAARYSALMADTQALVAEEALRHLRLDGVRHLMDVGGGTGVFLAHAARAAPGARLTLFDLPHVADAARSRFAAEGLAERTTVVPGSFRDGPLPPGADAISLVRVLYDHADATVAALLAKVAAALPPGGRVIVAEPMTGGARPHVPGDVYFALYCLAMRTGRARSAAEIAALLAAAGFADIRVRRTDRAYVTGVVEARRPLA
ncbi:methyltransferase domain-containing protein [Rhodobacteraceae bacterium CCMM004]|nr:methyltransferase domain-containing protein [Rhodobacteraceae bacterium CCMM004]